MKELMVLKVITEVQV